MTERTYLNWPFFEESHRQLANDFRIWADQKIAPLSDHEPRDDAGLDALARELVKRFAAGGWLQYSVPAPWGGKYPSLDVRALCLMREILAQYSGMADFSFVMQGLGSGPISLFGSEVMRRKYLPDVASGRRIAAFALSEVDSGSDVAAMKTNARLDGEHYILNGAKTLISNGGLADQYVVFCRTEDSPGARGLSALVVEANTPGLEVTDRFNVIAPHPLGRLEFKDCRVPASNLLGEPGDGFKIAMSSLDVFRSTVGAAALGFARRANTEAIAQARQRISFGKPIADYQLIQEKLADAALKIDAAALLVYRSAWTKDTQGGRVTREAAMAKLYATEMAQEVIDQAVQISGGMGVVVGSTVERLYREIRGLRIYEGTSEIQKLIIAGEALSVVEGEEAMKAAE